MNDVPTPAMKVAVCAAVLDLVIVYTAPIADAVIATALTVGAAVAVACWRWRR